MQKGLSNWKLLIVIMAMSSVMNNPINSVNANTLFSNINRKNLDADVNTLTRQAKLENDNTSLIV
jgi:hypothetical protein